MGTSFIPALLAIEPEPSDLTVVITGLLLVFLILILLTLIIALQGKFFDSLEAKKKQAKSAPAPSAPAPAKPVNGGNVSAAAVLPAPGAVTPEIVAVPSALSNPCPALRRQAAARLGARPVFSPTPPRFEKGAV